VTSAPFQTPEPLAEPGVFARASEWAPSILARLLGVGLVIAVLVLVVRPLAQALRTAGVNAAPRHGGGFLARDGSLGELAHENLSLAQQNPERAAQLVRQWLLESQKPTS
jgi:flagellar biosynthesis/type III secretory pathway M-ring protein FliF/YscJ